MKHVSWHISLGSEQDTQVLGEAIGRLLVPGEHLALVGAMGAGKTTLCRSIAKGYGVTHLAEVSSPTYAYAHEYHAPCGRLHHLDFHRITNVESAWALGLDDVLSDAQAPSLVEWADLCPELLRPDAVWLTLDRKVGESVRVAHLRAPSARAAAIAAGLPSAMRANVIIHRPASQ